MSAAAAAAARAWFVAASVGAVETLKDQMGICRWNYVMRTMHQHAKSNLRSYAQAKKLSSPASAAAEMARVEKLKQSEESLRKVMYLSCWGPN